MNHHQNGWLFVVKGSATSKEMVEMLVKSLHSSLIGFLTFWPEIMFTSESIQIDGKVLTVSQHILLVSI